MKRYFIFYQVVLLLIYIVMIIFFSYESLKEGSDSWKVSEVVADNIKKSTGDSSDVSSDFIRLIRKLIGHFGYFMVLGVVSILLYLSLEVLSIPFRILMHYFTGFSFAYITEFIFEANTKGRHPTIKDVGVNYLGFILISSIIIIVFIMKKKKKSKTV